MEWLLQQEVLGEEHEKSKCEGLSFIKLSPRTNVLMKVR